MTGHEVSMIVAQLTTCCQHDQWCTVSPVGDYSYTSGFEDGITSPDEIYGRIYPSSDVVGSDPMALAGDRDPDDLGGMPEPQATDDPHRDLPNLPADDVDPDDL
jgi:hypothetical protein